MPPGRSLPYAIAGVAILVVLVTLFIRREARWDPGIDTVEDLKPVLAAAADKIDTSGKTWTVVLDGADMRALVTRDSGIGTITLLVIAPLVPDPKRLDALRAAFLPYSFVPTTDGVIVAKTLTIYAPITRSRLHDLLDRELGRFRAIYVVASGRG